MDSAKVQHSEIFYRDLVWMFPKPSIQFGTHGAGVGSGTFAVSLSTQANQALANAHNALGGNVKVHTVNGTAQLTETWKHMLTNRSQEETIRVYLRSSDNVLLQSFETPLHKLNLFPEYAQEDDLPRWMTDRLAVLKVIDPDVGTFESRRIEGIGMRIAENVFWVTITHEELCNDQTQQQD